MQGQATATGLQGEFHVHRRPEGIDGTALMVYEVSGRRGALLARAAGVFLLAYAAVVIANPGVVPPA